MRKLSKYMLRRKVRAWGRLITEKGIVVVFNDGKIAIVYPNDNAYRSIRAWNWFNRKLYLDLADRRLPKPTPLHELLNQLGYRVTQ